VEKMILKSAFVCVLFCSFCSIKGNEDEGECSLFYVEINNKILVHEIEMYIDEINTQGRENKIIRIGITRREDSIIYHVTEPLSKYGMESSLTLFSKIKDYLVAISFHEIGDIGLHKDCLWKYLKDYFPDEYNVYLENIKNRGLIFYDEDGNEYYEEMKYFVLGGGLEWELIFKNDSLIDKKTYYTM
jgi:hypothetical protein